MQKDMQISPAQDKHNQELEIKTVTWVKDSHGLFDYESNQVNINKFQPTQTSFVYRNGIDTIFTENENNQIQNKDNLVIQIINNENQFYINKKEENFEQPYIIVRSIKNNDGSQKGYEIQAGDLLKLGRVEFRVIECYYNNDRADTYEQNTKNIMTIPDNYLDEYKQKNTNPVCRICLNDDNCEEGELIPINPCLCKGSCEFVHIACLKYWMASKISRKVQGCTMYFKTKYLECEVCKLPLPRTIKILDKHYNILNIEKPANTPYIILETLSKDKNLPQGLYIVSITSQEPIKMGRGNASDIRISDISVSRLHSFIKFVNNKFMLIDNNSKFGTLVQIKDLYKISYEKMAIQIGRTVITFALKQFNEINKNHENPLQQVIQNQQYNQISQDQKQQYLYLKKN